MDLQDAGSIQQTVDKSQIPPLHQKRIVAFINHFLISSCEFLNEFATKCESKLLEVERKMQKLESALLILEAKLDSLPNFEGTTLQNGSSSNTEKRGEPVEVEQDTSPDLETPSAVEPATIEEKGVRACDDTRYRKYFKMLQFGVPPQAVKLKMLQEGVENTEILNTPNLMLTDGILYEAAEM